MPFKVKVSLVVFMLVWVLRASSAQAIWEVHQITIPVTYTSASTQSIDATVPGHDPALGPLQFMFYGQDWLSGTGQINWTVQNNTSATVTDTVQVALNSQVSVKGTSQVLDRSSAGFSYSPQFTLAPNDSYTFHETDDNGAGMGASFNDPDTLDDFTTAGNVILNLQTNMTAKGTFSSIPAVGVSGSITSTDYVDVDYKYYVSAPANTIALKTASSTVFGAFNSPAIVWYKLDYSSGNLTINTLGSSTLFKGAQGTTLGIYNSLGTLIGHNDNGPGFTGSNQGLSQLSFTNGELAPGSYYIAVGVDSVDYSDTTDFNANPYSAFETGANYQLNVAIVAPEPASITLWGCALGGYLFKRRQRIEPGNARPRST